MRLIITSYGTLKEFNLPPLYQRIIGVLSGTRFGGFNTFWKFMKNTRMYCIKGFLFVALVTYCANASDRYATLAYPGDSLTLTSNETALVVSTVPRDSGFNWTSIEYQRGTNAFLPISLPVDPMLPVPQMPLVGPGIIRLSGPEDGGYVGLKILTAGSVTAGLPSTGIPSTAVVIPADANGPVSVILESSQDLITWNVAMPGTYGNSNSNRFFRIRAVQQAP